MAEAKSPSLAFAIERLKKNPNAVFADLKKDAEKLAMEGKNVTIVVTVLMISCHVPTSFSTKIVGAHTTTRPTHSAKKMARLAAFEAAVANRSNTPTSSDTSDGISAWCVCDIGVSVPRSSTFDTAPRGGSAAFR